MTPYTWANLCNYPPRVTSIAPNSVLAGAAYTYQIVAADAENDPLVFALVKSPAGMTMDANGLISWTPTYAQHSSSNPVGVYVTDGHATIYNTFAVAVKWQNVAPTAPAMQTAAAAEYQLLSYQVLASDPDNQLLTYTTSDPMPNGLALGSTGILSGTPALSGMYVVNVRVTDPFSAFVTTAVIINVAAGVIQPPAIVPIPNATISAPVAFNYSVSASDPQGAVPGLQLYVCSDRYDHQPRRCHQLVIQRCRKIQHYRTSDQYQRSLY